MNKDIAGDVIVIGGGSAGVTAALAAARNGSKCILVERYGFLGGTATIIHHLAGFKDREGNQIIGGLADEVIKTMQVSGGSLGHVHGGSSESSTLIDPELFKYYALKLNLEAGVKVLFHSFFTDAVVEDNKIKEIVIHNKSGRQVIKGKVFVDCTGDADVAALTGCPFEKGRDNDGRLQPVSMTFRIANFKKQEFIEYLENNPQELEKSEKWSDGENLERLKSDDWSGFKGLDKLAERVRNETGYELPRDRLHFCTTMHEGIILVNTSRILNIDATNQEDLSRAEIEGRKQVIEISDFLKKYVPGFKDSYVLDTGVQIGIRETRRIIGEYVMTVDDIVNGTEFDDAISQGIYPIDIHDVDGRGMRQIRVYKPYQIPFRSLVPKKIRNLIAAGRCISATHEAMGALRVISNCMAMGEAAGTAAHMAADSGVDINSIDKELLRKRLVSQGVIIPKK